MLQASDPTGQLVAEATAAAPYPCQAWECLRSGERRNGRSRRRCRSQSGGLIQSIASLIQSISRLLQLLLLFNAASDVPFRLLPPCHIFIFHPRYIVNFAAVSSTLQFCVVGVTQTVSFVTVCWSSSSHCSWVLWTLQVEQICPQSSLFPEWPLTAITGDLCTYGAVQLRTFQMFSFTASVVVVRYTDIVCSRWIHFPSSIYRISIKYHRFVVESDSATPPRPHFPKKLFDFLQISSQYPPWLIYRPNPWQDLVSSLMLVAVILKEITGRDSNPGPVFSIPGFGIGEFLIPGSRRDYGIPVVWYQKPLLLSKKWAYC